MSLPRRYWIISLPRNDMERCIKIGKFGLNKKYLLGRIRKGDGIVCYVTKEARVIAIGKVTEGYYQDNSRVFLSEGKFSHRIDFAAQSLENEVDFRGLVEEMRFISNPQYWGAHLQLGVAEIPKEDWETIDKSVRRVNKHLGVDARAEV